MNAIGMNAAVGPGGPVGGGMGMNSGSPANQALNPNPEQHIKMQLNTYIYEYFIRLGHYEIARALRDEAKFEIRTKAGVKQSPGRRKDGDVNGIDTDAMDMEMKSDVPDDLLPPALGDPNIASNGFLFEWFSIFSDLYGAHRRTGNANPAAQQYLLQQHNMQRLRENNQNQALARSGMMNPRNFAAMGNMRNGMMNGDMNKLTKTMTPQQLQQMQAQRQQQILQQQAAMQQQQREQGDVDMNGRPSTPTDGEGGQSPSKRPRLDGQQFNPNMMPNGRPGMAGVPQQPMMIQSGFNPNMNPQFRQNNAMPQKAMQANMANGMMNMPAGSPMMQPMANGQFGEVPLDMYNGRMPGQPPMQGGPNGQSGNHALQDYQMQLMLLEQQNKKRLMMARQEQDSLNPTGRDGGPMPPGMTAPGMSPSGSRSGASPNPTDQMKRTPQLGGMPGSPAAGDTMQGRSPAAMGFMNGMQPQDFNAAMFMKGDGGGMGPGGPGMARPPTSMEMNAMARQQANRMGGQFAGGQPMVQQPSQGGQPQVMGTPAQRNEMPPPQAPAVNNSAQRNQPSSPSTSNAPPTPSQTNKPNPKGKKGKDDAANKKRPAKKNSTANAPQSEGEPPATPTPSTPITPQHANFTNSGGKAQVSGVPVPIQAPTSNPTIPPNQPPMPQPDLQTAFPDFTNTDPNFNLDFSTLEDSNVLENFDFDSFLNTNTDDTFNFDSGIGVGDMNFDPGE